MPWEPITTVDQLVARFENSIFDFKTTYDLDDRLTRHEIAKDIAAFANALGGTIVVGVRERGGKAVKLEGVSDLAALSKATATALQRYCAPVPSGPEEHEISVSPSDAARLLANGAAHPGGSVTIVTLNVRHDPRGPIGVRPADAVNGQPLVGAYRFPLRIDDQTRFLDPVELPMWMNSHERRIALQLRQIPRGAQVRAFHVRFSAGVPESERVMVERIDEEQMIAVFSRVGEGRVNVPLTFISAVWCDAADSVWTIKIEGTVFLGMQQGPAFKPRVD